MNILYIAPFTTPAFLALHGNERPESPGGVRKAGLIIKALTARNHRVVVLSSAVLSNSRPAWRPRVHERLKAGNRSAKVIYPSALMLRPWGSLLNCLRAPRLIRLLLPEFVPQAAITYNSNLFETLAAGELQRSLKIPLILQVEDLPLARRREWMNVKPHIDQRCWLRMSNLASAYTAVNSFILDRLPADRPRYLLPGIVDPQLLEARRSRSPAFSGTRRTVGYFGSLAPGKGLEVLLGLGPRLPAGWRLLVTGSGELATDFEQIGARYPEKVNFLGLVKDSELYEAMCACDCTVIPREEIMGGGQGVFPFKAFEYLTSGSHVIATPMGRVADPDVSFIQRWDGGLNSLLGELAKSEVEFRRERSIREKAVDMILTRYSPVAVADLFAEILSQVTRSSAEQGKGLRCEAKCHR